MSLKQGAKARILEILSDENYPELSSDEIVNVLNSEGIGSRATIFKARDELIEEGKITIMKDGRKTIHFLSDGKVPPFNDDGSLSIKKLILRDVDALIDLILKSPSKQEVCAIYNDDHDAGMSIMRDLHMIHTACEKMLIMVDVFEKKTGLKFDRPWEDDEEFVRQLIDIDLECAVQTLNTWLIFLTSLKIDLETQMGIM